MRTRMPMLRKLILALPAACLLVPAVAQAQLFPNLGGQRVGISALPCLKNNLSPRSTAMGGADVSQSGDGYSATLNPALAGDIKNATVSTSNLYYGSALNHTLVSAIVPVKAAGTFYSNLNMLNMGAEKVRDEFHPQGTGEYFTAYTMAAELGYSRNLSNRFSIGVGLKYIREQLAQYSANSVAADIGFLYRTDWRNLRFGASLQNFGTNSALQGNYSPDLTQTGATTSTEGYPAPTLFKMGASMDALSRPDHLLTVHAQLNHPNDNAENIRLGAEYVWADMLMLRTGVKLGVDNERIPTAGLGYRWAFGGHRLQFDYGINPTRYLGIMHSLGISFVIGKPEALETPETPAAQ